MSIKACEEPDCQEAGLVFYRDPTGYGHWLCAAHRDLWALGDSRGIERPYRAVSAHSA